MSEERTYCKDALLWPSRTLKLAMEFVKVILSYRDYSATLYCLIHVCSSIKRHEAANYKIDCNDGSNIWIQSLDTTFHSGIHIKWTLAGKRRSLETNRRDETKEWFATQIKEIIYGLKYHEDYWYYSITNHLKKDLSMKQLTGYLACLSNLKDGKLEGLIGIHVDDP